MSALTHLLYESASGYALFEVKLHDEIANSTKQFQDSLAELNTFGKMVQLKSFAPFTSAAHALENANDVSEGECFLLIQPHDDSAPRGVVYRGCRPYVDF